jgi:hypothetical protein
MHTLIARRAGPQPAVTAGPGVLSVVRSPLTEPGVADLDGGRHSLLADAPRPGG